MMWDEEERAAFTAVKKLRSEMRGMGLTHADGGFMVPFTFAVRAGLRGHRS